MNNYWRNIRLFFILVFLYASVSNMYADVRKSQKAYRVEMAKAGNYYFKSDMANALKSLRKVYVQALEEEDHATMLEAVDLLCQVQESMEFISALEKNAQQLKAFSSNIHDVEDVAYYESMAYQYLAFCKIYQKDVAGFEAMLDSASHVLHHCQLPENQLFLRLSIEDYRSFGYYYVDRYQQAYYTYHSFLDKLDELVKTQNKHLYPEDERTFRMVATSSLALVSFKVGKTEEAEEWCNKSLKMYDDSLDLLYVMPDIVEYLLLSKQDKRVCEVAEDYIKTTAPSLDVLFCMEFLMRAYERLGETNRFYETNKRYISIRDSLDEVRNDVVMVEMNNLFQVMDSYRNIHEKDKRITNLKYALGISLLLLLILALVIMYQLKLKKERKQSVNLVKKLNRKIGTPRLSSEQPIGKAVEDDKTDSIGLQNKVMAYMEEEQRYLDSDFSLKPLAQEMQMTLREIEEKYQYLTGEPISEMRIRLRLKYACEQLENTDKKMEVIAEEAGFGSVRTFYRQFKTEYNMTPNVFRQVSKNE